jgi:thioredoxin-related protein
MIAVNSMPVAFRAGELSRKKWHLQWRRICSHLMLFCVSMTATVSAVAEGVSKAPRDPMEYFFHQSFNNLQEEIAIADEEKKSGIFIMFSDKDCPWCLKMKTTILNRVDVQDYYREHFRNLTIDIRGDTPMTDFEGNEVSEKDFAFKQHRVRATPVFMFFDTSGKAVMRLTGIVRDAREFLWLGEFVVSGEYQKTNFTKYKRDRAEQAKTVSGGS